MGQILTVNARMEIARDTAEVTVLAEAPPLAKSDASVGAVIAKAQVQNLPLNGRVSGSMMALAPGAIDSGKVLSDPYGSRASDKMTTISAVTAWTSPASPSNRPIVS